MRGRALIVKVQIALYPPDDPATLIYDQARSIIITTVTTPELRKRMAGRPKAFFHAHLTEQRQVELGAEAPWQTW